MVFRQLPQKLQRGVLVSPRLHQHVEDFALMFDRVPSPNRLITDPNVPLIQMPAAGWRTPGGLPRGMIQL